MSDTEKLDYSLLLNQCKLLAYAHHVVLRPAPAKFIACFFDPSFQNVCDSFQMPPVQYYAKAAVVSLIFLMLPLGYGHTFMDYPCSPVPVVIGDKTDAFRERVMQHSDENCYVEDFIRSPWSLLLAPGAYLVGTIIFEIVHKFASSWRVVFGWIGPWLYALQVNSVRPSLPNTWCQPAHGPGAFEFPMNVYHAILLQMLALAVFMRSAVGVLVAFALGRLFLALCNVVFSTSGTFANAVECELAEASEALKRVYNDPVRTSMWVKQDELDDLWAHDRLRKAVLSDQLPSHFWMLGARNLDARVARFDQTPIFLTTVYLGEHNITVDLLNNSVKKPGKLSLKSEIVTETTPLQR